jgi:hypothetical protein
MIDHQVRLGVDVAVTGRAVRLGARKVVTDRAVRRGVKRLVTGLQSPTNADASLEALSAGDHHHHPLSAAADR